MRITARHLRQIIREELSRLSEQDPVDSSADDDQDSASAERSRDLMYMSGASKAREYLKSRSDISGYIPYVEPNRQTLMAMLPADSGGKADPRATRVTPPKNSNIVWQVDDRLQARIVRIENALGSVDLKGASGDGMYYVTNVLDLGPEISRKMGGRVLTPEDKREISKNIRKIPGALTVPVKSFFAIIDATGGGTGNAPRGVKSIYIKSVSNPI